MRGFVASRSPAPFGLTQSKTCSFFKPSQTGRASTGSARTVLGVASLFLASPALAASPLAGAYIGSRQEMAAALKLNANGSFEYLMSYGALDERAKGRWTERDGKVFLTSSPTPKAPAFDIVSDTASEDGKLHVALDNPDALGGFSLTVRLLYPGNPKPVFVEADEDGTVPLPPGPPPASVVPDLPVYDTVLAPYALKGAARSLMFRFAPNDLGIADFRDEPLTVEGGELVMHRFDETVRFRKGGQ